MRASLHKWTLNAIFSFDRAFNRDEWLLILDGPLRVGDIAYDPPMGKRAHNPVLGWQHSPMTADEVQGIGSAGDCYAVARQAAGE